MVILKNNKQIKQQKWLFVRMIIPFLVILLFTKRELNDIDFRVRPLKIKG
jgi:hypothetical protein